jgi:hypothetical protein
MKLHYYYYFLLTNNRPKCMILFMWFSQSVELLYFLWPSPLRNRKKLELEERWSGDDVLSSDRQADSVWIGLKSAAALAPFAFSPRPSCGATVCSARTHYTRDHQLYSATGQFFLERRGPENNLKEIDRKKPKQIFLTETIISNLAYICISRHVCVMPGNTGEQIS